MSVMSMLALSVSMNAKCSHGFLLDLDPKELVCMQSHSRNVTAPDCQCRTEVKGLSESKRVPTLTRRTRGVSRVHLCPVANFTWRVKASSLVSLTQPSASLFRPPF